MNPKLCVTLGLFVVLAVIGNFAAIFLFNNPPERARPPAPSKSDSLVPPHLRYRIHESSPSPPLSDKPPWPPLKVFVYPATAYHTTDCLYPPELPTRYVNTTGYWWQGMLDPTIHHQYLHAPILVSSPSDADLFIIPHYSRMCSGLDGALRWNAIPGYVSETGNFFRRYSAADHFVMHSVPHYGDKPADIAVGRDKAPMVGILDFQVGAIRGSPWLTSRSLVLPFITLNASDSFHSKRRVSVFVAMSTSTKGLRASSAILRQNISQQLALVDKSLIVVIKRRSYSTFKSALTSLPKKISRSQICIVPPGDAPSSKRFYDAISYYCIPYLLADNFFLPYEDVLVEYEKCMRQLASRKVGTLAKELNAIPSTEVKRLRKALKIVKERFT
jgi:hypothetical protein